MNSDDSVNREALIRLISLVKPALATQDYIPALKHILFAHGFASAYNDNSSIQVALPTRDLDLDLCLPGELLGKALAGFNAEKVALQPNEKDGSLVLASGRARIKVKTLPAASYPLELPKGKAAVLALSDDILAGIRRCLVSVGNNPHHPAGMGVTLDAVDGKATLYSTDNATISRYQTKTRLSLPGDAPVILPSFFCEQLGSLAKSIPKAEIDVKVYAGALVAEFIVGDDVAARLFTKTLVDFAPIDFPRIIAKHCDTAKITKKLVEIPNSFDAAFDRALLVLGAEADKFTKITPTGDSSIKLLTLGNDGEASDQIELEALDIDEPFNLDPALILRAIKNCTHLAFANRVVVFGDADGRFLHLVSHCSN